MEKKKKEIWFNESVGVVVKAYPNSRKYIRVDQLRVIKSALATIIKESEMMAEETSEGLTNGVNAGTMLGRAIYLNSELRKSAKHARTILNEIMKESK